MAERFSRSFRPSGGFVQEFRRLIRVVQLGFHLWCTLFNRAVKNDVEKAAVTSVTLRDLGPFSPLHLMRCGILRNCESGPKWFIHQAFLMELMQLTSQAAED
jgi:hypothetical protein